MATKPTIDMPRLDVRAGKPPRLSAHMADKLIAIIGGAAAMAGIWQLMLPITFEPVTGLAPGNAAAIVGALWTVLGAAMIVGGALRLRAVAIHAAVSMSVASGSGFAVMLWIAPAAPSLAFHGGLVFMSLVGSVVLYLTDRSELKKELSRIRASNERPAEGGAA